jgi:hypothetical protein
MASAVHESLLAGFGARDPDTSGAFVRRFQSRVFGSR